MRNAQASSEYLIILGFIVGITVPLLVVYFTFTNEINDQIIVAQIDKVTKSIIDAADMVYFLGEPSQTSLRVYIPVNVNAVTMINKAIIYKVRTKAGVSDISYISSANLTGSLPISSGIHLITVRASEGGNVVLSST